MNLGKSSRQSKVLVNESVANQAGKGQVARQRTGCGQEQAEMNLEQRLEH